LDIDQSNNTQDWKDPENNLIIHFTYLPEYPLPRNITTLIFRVQNLQTGNYLKNLLAGITIINNLTTAKMDGIMGLMKSRCDFTKGMHPLLAYNSKTIDHYWPVIT
jgi:hypothetical protein